jgi:hypothetical protein
LFRIRIVQVDVSTEVSVGHLAISRAIAAAKYGRRVYYSTLADLVTNLEEAQAAGTVKRRLSVLTHPALMVIDEIGYIPIIQTGAMLYIQLMSRRCEHASTILTSNKGFDAWGEVLGDEVMAAALINRVLHHCHIVNIRGNSYRMVPTLKSGRLSIQTTKTNQGRRPDRSDTRGGCAVFIPPVEMWRSGRIRVRIDAT